MSQGARKVVTAAAVLLLLPLGRTTVGDGTSDLDGCELEALKAYGQALALCRLAEDENPRLRCYEAAKRVYLQTLEDCRSGKPPQTR